MQRFSLKHLQKVESNKSLTAKNDKEQQLQLRQAEKDYYELFEALSERDRANAVMPSPFAVYLQQQSQSQYGTAATVANTAAAAAASAANAGGADLADHASKIAATSDLHSYATAEEFQLSLAEEKSFGDSEGEEWKLGERATKLDDFIPGRRKNRAIEELSALSSKKTVPPPLFSPGVQNGAFMSPPMTGIAERTSSAETATMHEGGAGGGAGNGAGNGTRLHSVGASAKRNARISVQTPASVARSVKLRRGLSSKFAEEGAAAGHSHTVKVMPPAEHAHDRVYHGWATRSLNNIPVHHAMALSMDRATEVAIDHHAFCRRFDQECRRSFEHVHTLSGVLEVTPMQALHLPEAKNPMLVRVSYGEQVQ